MDAFTLGLFGLATGVAATHGCRWLFFRAPLCRGGRMVFGCIVAFVAAASLLIGALAAVDLWIHREEMVNIMGVMAELPTLIANASLLALFLFYAWILYHTVRRAVRRTFARARG